jgi:hypothetical protein
VADRDSGSGLSDVDAEALVRDGELDAFGVFLEPGAGAGADLVEGVVGAIGIVVEEHEATGFRKLAELEHVLDERMAESALVGHIGRDVLRVVDQEVHAVGEAREIVDGDDRASSADFVVGEVGDGGAAVVDAKSLSATGVIQLNAPNLGRTDLLYVTLGSRELDLRRNVIHADGEVDVVENVALKAFLRFVRERVNEQVVVLVVEGREERQAHHVVPVGV